MSQAGPVAIVDIGSNSIKLLVANLAPGGGVHTLHHKTSDVRISAGISRATPELGEAGMRAGVDAVSHLLSAARPYGPQRTVLVATSAVRDAGNGGHFAARILEATGFAVRILSGEEEARLIGTGVRADPALRHLQEFNLFDLGGGSLECLSVESAGTTQALSLPLGCVRLTEMFVPEPAAAFTQDSAAAIARHVDSALRASGFRFGPANRAAVFAGGSMTTARAIAASLYGRETSESPTVLSRELLGRILEHVGALPLQARRMQVAGLPPARADVFPAALVTMLAIADLARVRAFHHTVYNLRYGLAAELLADELPLTEAHGAG